MSERFDAVSSVARGAEVERLKRYEAAVLACVAADRMADKGLTAMRIAAWDAAQRGMLALVPKGPAT